jgi:glycosyltransferase involved in cell wall biosynthesis
MDLLESFHGTAKSLTVVCTGPDVFSGRLGLASQDHVRVRREPTLNSFGVWYRLFRETRPFAVVLVKSWMWCFPWYALLAAKLAGVSRRINILHLPPAPRGPGIPAWRYYLGHRRLALCSTATVCVSDSQRRHLVEECGYSPARTFTIPNGVALGDSVPDVAERARIRQQLEIPEGEILLVCVASLVAQKRVDVLLEALALMAGDSPKFHCIILGEGELRESLEQRTAELALSGRVRFLGFQADVNRFLRGADLFVLTSDQEGMPLSILEAMACGLPCVVTDVGGNAEMITDGVHGRLVPRRDVAAIAQTLRTLLADPAQRAAMSAAALRRVREQFDLRQSTGRIRNLILNGNREKENHAN